MKIQVAQANNASTLNLVRHLPANRGCRASVNSRLDPVQALFMFHQAGLASDQLVVSPIQQHTHSDQRLNVVKKPSANLKMTENSSSPSRSSKRISETKILWRGRQSWKLKIIWTSTMRKVIHIY